LQKAHEKAAGTDKRHGGWSVFGAAAESARG